MASTWNAEAAGRLRGALERGGNKHGPDIADRAIRRLDEYAQTWKETYRSVAEATLLHGRQEAGVMTRRVRCLDRGREQLAAVSDVLTSPDVAVTEHALDAVYALPASEACATTDVANLPALPALPELRARVLVLERIVAQALALVDVGAFAKAEELAQRGIAEAQAIPYARTEAALLLIAGDTRRQSGDKKGAMEDYLHAFGAGQSAADDPMAGRAAARMASVLSNWMGKTEEAERWNYAAEKIASRVGHDDALQVEILNSRAAINNWRGGANENPELHDKIIALTRRLYGDTDLRVAQALAARSLTYEMLSKSERAIEDRRAAIDMITTLTGADNPFLANDYLNLGISFLTLHRYAEAKTAFEHASELQEGVTSSLLVNINEGLVEAHLRSSPPEVTLAVVDKAIDLARANGDDGMHEWSLHCQRAEALAQKGDFAGKAEECRKMLAVQEARGKALPTVPYYPDALTCLGEAELALHQTKSGIAHLERSVSMKTRYTANELPRVRFVLAKALRASGRELKRARDLAESAREDLRTAQGCEGEVADIDKWLEAR
jgi:tetratricopeptide (TPR) repeat protein